ncbi:hypothetical protein BFL35_12735 [Clavibacter michiganensis]|nr:hypothetical protein BFL35_12735 [Clavibacter michiganensis]
MRPALAGRGDGSGDYLVPTDVPPTTSPRPEGAALPMLTRQQYPGWGIDHALATGQT